MLHKDIPVGADSSHPPGYVQSGDPGAVGAYKVWVDTSGGTGAWAIKVRNAADSGWETVRGGGGSALPIDAAATAAVGSGDLFAGTSLDGGWSSLQSTPLTSVDRSIDGYCILKNSGSTAGELRGLKRAFSPAGDFQVYSKILSSTFGVTGAGAGIVIGATDPTDNTGTNLQFMLTSDTAQVYAQCLKHTTGTPSTVFSNVLTTTSLFGAANKWKDSAYPFPAWLRIKRVGSTISLGISWEGVRFIDLLTTTTISFTVANIGIATFEYSATSAIEAVFGYIATTG